MKTYCKSKVFTNLAVLSISMLMLLIPTSTARSQEQPNFLLVVADDMGFSDIGAYGSEISTPNLDSLADEGMLFTNFHTLPTCSPTRSELLTGVDNHRNGLGTMDHLLHGTNQEGKQGYEGFLNKQVVTVASLLKDAGYHTYMVGKWHLGKDDFLPYYRGFEETFILIPGGASHYNDRANYSPYFSKANYSQNGQIIEDELPDDFYSTTYYTDKLLEFINKNEDDNKPFFAYVAYTAAHAPLQAPDDYIEKYINSYNGGWDNLREARFKKMQEMGLIPDYISLPDRWDIGTRGVPAWDELSAQEKALEAKEMAVYAAMIDYMDASIGRIIQTLKDNGQYENTVIMFLTDNGADWHDNAGPNGYKWIEAKKYDNSIDNVGKKNSFASLNAGWAQVSASPFYGGKGGVSEGGIRAEFLVSYPNKITAGSRSHALATVRDVTPTILEYAGVSHPGTEADDTPHMMDGRSMKNLWEGQTNYIYGENDPVSFEIYGTVNKALIMGDWKILRLGDAPWGAGESEPWKLFHIKADPRELDDLSTIFPNQRAKMIDLYNEYETRVGYVGKKSTPIGFSEELWDFSNVEEYRIEEYLGVENALYLQGGQAILTDVSVTTGTLEYDIAFGPETGFFGAVWDMQDQNNFENFYMLPHESGQAGAMQYTPFINGVANWQLYHGDGFTAEATYPFNQWVHVKIVFSRERAAIYIDHGEDAVMVSDLKLGQKGGQIGLEAKNIAPYTGAYFANFAYSDLQTPPDLGQAGDAVIINTEAVTSWMVSDVFEEEAISNRIYLTDADKNRTWTELPSEMSGLANLAQVQTINGALNTVFARTTITSDVKGYKKMSLGFSDRGRVYVNDQLVYVGDNSFATRDFRYLGTIGYFNEIYIPVNAGDNEIWIAVSENFGGWGVQASFDVNTLESNDD